MGMFLHSLSSTDLSVDENYKVFCCAPDFDGTEKLRERFMDAGPGLYTALPENIFLWLLTIRPGCLVLCLGDRCIIEPYLPCRFARQFRYDQLYVGNPNPRLAVVGNLYEGARAFYFWTTGNSLASFLLPLPSPNCYTVLRFCKWYQKALQIPEYNIYTSCLKDIRAMYESRKDSRLTRLKGIDEFLACEQEALRVDITHEEAEEARAPEEAQGIKASEGRVTGKMALTVEEEARYERRTRQRSMVKRM